MKVKREEQEKSRKEILELRRDMERTHELKSEALMSREKNAIERLRNHQEVKHLHLDISLIIDRELELLNVLQHDPDGGEGDLHTKTNVAEGHGICA